MGFFDALFGTNTSAGTTSGAMAGIDAIGQGATAGNRALRKTTTQANDALTANAKLGTGALDAGYGSAIGALGDAGKLGQGLLQKGVDSGVAATLAGNDAFQPYATSGGGASTMLGNALGLNGPAGNAAATSAFQSSPGYQFQQDQAADQTSRKMASLGLAGSGSTLDAILRGSSNLANTEYQGYLSNLSNLATQGLSAASGISGNDRGAGALQAAGGTAGANLAQGIGTSTANAYANQGTGRAGIFSNLGQGLSSNLVGEGQGISGNDLNSALASSQLALGAGQAQDQATNANNSILSKLIGGALALPLGSTSLLGTASPLTAKGY